MRVPAGGRNPLFRNQWAAGLISRLLSSVLTLIIDLRQQTAIEETMVTRLSLPVERRASTRS